MFKNCKKQVKNLKRYIRLRWNYHIFLGMIYNQIKRGDKKEAYKTLDSLSSLFPARIIKQKDIQALKKYMLTVK